MPTNLIDDSSQFPTPVQVPAPGEPRSSAGIIMPLQALANRTANAKARVDAIMGNAQTSDGLRRMRRVPDLAALAAIGPTDRSDGDVCVVTGVGLYEYLSADSTAALTNIVIVPTGAPASGRWGLVGRALRNAPNGFIAGDEAGRVAATRVHNGIVGAFVATPGGSTATSPTPTDVSGASYTTADVAAGDLITAGCSASISAPAGATVTLQIAVTDGAGSYVAASAEWKNETSSPALWPMSASGGFTALRTSSHTIHMQVATSAGTATIYDPGFRVLVMRP